MAHDFNQLQEMLRQQLVALFQEHAAPGPDRRSGIDSDAGPEALAFEPIGIPLPSSGFRLADAEATLSPDIANETLTMLADAVPDVSGGEYRRTLRSVTAAYEQTLFALALPGQTREAIAAIERTQAAAQATFEQAKRPALSTGLDFRPTFVVPLKWYDPEADVWTKFTSTAVAGSAASVSTPRVMLTAPAPAAGPALPSWKWKVLPPADRQRVATELASARAVTAGSAAAAGPSRASPGQASVSNLQSALTASPMRGILRASAMPTLKTRAEPPMRKISSLEKVWRLTPPPKPVEAKPAALEINFEACVLTLARPWMSWSWMDTRGWYMPGYRAGQLCRADHPLHLLPVSAILVRNLTLSARGAQSDELKDAVAFGPFQFLDQKVAVEAKGSTYDVSVTCPTVQLIAWLTQPLSGLPPKTDPTVPET